MKTIKTARGKNLNMAQLAAQNEKQRAVSNVPINARGDIIDNRGNVKVTKENVQKEYYRDNLQGIEEPVSIKTDDIEHLDAEISYNKPLIKKICEDLYYDGKIERTGNYKYSYKLI